MISIGDERRFLGVRWGWRLSWLSAVWVLGGLCCTVQNSELPQASACSEAEQAACGLQHRSCTAVAGQAAVCGGCDAGFTDMDGTCVSSSVSFDACNPPPPKAKPQCPRYARCVAQSATAYECPCATGFTKDGAGVCQPQTTYLSVSVGLSFACAHRSDLGIDCWGYEAQGRLGRGPISTPPQDKLLPGPIAVVQDNSARDIKTWLGLSVKGGHACSIQKYEESGGNGFSYSLWCFGDNTAGALGGGALSAAKDTPAVVDNFGSQSWQEVSAGRDHNCAIPYFGMKSDRALACWGDNTYGQLGAGTPATNGVLSVGDSNGMGNGTAGMAHANPYKPVLIGQSSEQWQSTSAGGFHSCAIDGQLKLWCWGRNNKGQLGTGSTSDSATKRAPSKMTLIRSVSAGELHTCAIQLASADKKQGTLWCWGNNEVGQLGVGSSDLIKKEPTQVGADSDWVSVSAGEIHTCAIKADQSLWCWGSNSQNILGVDNAPTIAATPRKTRFPAFWKSISCGPESTCGITEESAVQCFGSDSHGQSAPFLLH